LETERCVRAGRGVRGRSAGNQPVRPAGGDHGAGAVPVSRTGDDRCRGGEVGAAGAVERSAHQEGERAVCADDREPAVGAADGAGSLTGVWRTKAEAQIRMVGGDGTYPGPIRSAMLASDPLMMALGRPNREQVVTSRSGTATTLQAIELTNGAVLDGILRQGA